MILNKAENILWSLEVGLSNIILKKDGLDLAETAFCQKNTKPNVINTCRFYIVLVLFGNPPRLPQWVSLVTVMQH